MASKLKLQEKAKRRTRRRLTTRKVMKGSEACPRLVVFRSNASIYAQIVDDSKGFTIAAADSRKLGEKLPKSELSKRTGMALAEEAKKKGVSSVIFDRNGYLYHGRVKALAEGAREGGLKF
jgi:large subunit ribosomal protein L18